MIENDNKDIKFYDNSLGYIMGKRMAETRKKNGMTLEELSFRLKLKLSRYEAYEKGKRNCSIGLVKEFCNVLNIDFNEFFGEILQEADKEMRKYLKNNKN